MGLQQMSRGVLICWILAFFLLFNLVDGGKKINKNLRFDEIFQPHFLNQRKIRVG